MGVDPVEIWIQFSFRKNIARGKNDQNQPAERNNADISDTRTSAVVRPDSRFILKMNF